MQNYYYSICYKTNPSSLSPEIEKEIGNDYRQYLLLKRQNKLDDSDIENALLLYLKQKKIEYKELIILEIRGISEQEYIDRTQYV
ncbi:MAG TPA: hypothetical protein VFF23_14550 [Hanamia sp.]|nr:hypothetical protein [Hanamia sp.]